MGKFKTITASVIQFCHDAIKYISGKDLLEDKFKVLLDDSSSQTDQEHAKKIIKVLCNSLSTRALNRAKDCETFSGELDSFAKTTKGDRDTVRKLDRKYVGKKDSDNKYYVIDENDNWVYGGLLGMKVENYLSQISASATYYANEAISERKKAAEDWDKWRDLTIVATTATTYILIPVIGWFAGPAVAIGAGTAGMYTILLGIVAHGTNEKQPPLPDRTWKNRRKWPDKTRRRRSHSTPFVSPSATSFHSSV